MYEISKATEFLSQLSTDQMIILKLITEKYDVEVHATLMSYKQSLPAVKNNFWCHDSMKTLDQPN